MLLDELTVSIFFIEKKFHISNKNVYKFFKTCYNKNRLNLYRRILMYKLIKKLDDVVDFTEVSAHCDMPCGIYDPITAQISALTVVRMVDMLETHRADPKPKSLEDQNAETCKVVKDSAELSTSETHNFVGNGDAEVFSTSEARNFVGNGDSEELSTSEARNFVGNGDAEALSTSEMHNFVGDGDPVEPKAETHQADPEPKSLQDQNSVARIIAIKEIHAENVKHEIRIIWGDFLKQPHFEKYPQLNTIVHDIMLLGSENKQHVNRKSAVKLVDKVNEFAEIFWAIKGEKTVKAVAPYPPKLELVYRKV